MESRISKIFAVLSLLILLRSEDKLFFFRKTKKHFTNHKKCGILNESHRGVAQFGRALRSGRRGRKFESCHLDQLQKAELRFFVVQPFSLSGRFCEKQAFPKRRGENGGRFPYDCPHPNRSVQLDTNYRMCYNITYHHRFYRIRKQRMMRCFYGMRTAR